MIFTFYGFKGGVGRTLALVHAASILSSTRGPYGNRVLVMDLDLEAPSVFLHFPPPDPALAQRGFVELMLDYLTQERDAAWLSEELAKTVYRVSDDLFVFPSGDYTSSRYLEGVQRLGEAHAAGFFSALKDACQSLYDYVLIDSRTGLAEVAAAATILLGDALVACFRPNQANLGIGMIIQRFLAHRDQTRNDSAARIVPVLTPRPAMFSLPARRWALRFQEEIFGPHLPVEIPFDPILEAGEVLLMIPPGSIRATLEDGRVKYTDDGRTDLGAPIVKAYLELAERLASMNTERDVISARQAELTAYLERRYREALGYLFQAIRRKPEEREQWNVLMRRYVPTALDQGPNETPVREIIRGFLNECLGSGAGALETPRGRAWAHVIRAAKFGKGVEDGLPDVLEALRLCDETDVASDAHFLAAQIIFYQSEKTLVGGDLSVMIQSRRRAMNLALEHIDQARAACGETERILRFRGQLHEEIGEYEQAIEDFDRAASISSSPAELLLESAETLEHIGRYGDALRRYLTAVDVAPSHEEIYRRFIPTLYRLGHCDVSRQFIDRWQALNVTSAEPLRYQLGVAVTLGDPPEIESWLASVRQNDSAGGRIIPWALLRLERYEEAADCVSDSADAGAYDRLQLVLAFAGLGRDVLPILALPAESASGGNFLALAAMVCGEIDVARRHLQTSLIVESVLPLGWRTNLQLVEALLEAHDDPTQRKATDALLESLHTNPENALWTRNQIELQMLRAIWPRYAGSRGEAVSSRWDELFGVWDSIQRIPFSRYTPFVLRSDIADSTQGANRAPSPQIQDVANAKRAQAIES